MNKKVMAIISVTSIVSMLMAEQPSRYVKKIDFSKIPCEVTLDTKAIQEDALAKQQVAQKQPKVQNVVAAPAQTAQAKNEEARPSNAQIRAAVEGQIREQYGFGDNVKIAVLDEEILDKLLAEAKEEKIARKEKIKKMLE